MRIVSGAHKGRTIRAPKNLPTRPTTDMAKEALFNILNNYFYFDQVNVLDLFSGTGNLSYEFFSRGSKRIVSVDSNSGCVRFIQKMSDQLNAEDSIEPIKTDVFKYLENAHESFDIVFADPPYDFEEYEKLINLVFNRNLLKKDGILVIEHDFKHKFESLDYFYSHRKYGSVNFSFFTIPSVEEIE